MIYKKIRLSDNFRFFHKGCTPKMKRINDRALKVNHEPLQIQIRSKWSPCRTNSLGPMVHKWVRRFVWIPTNLTYRTIEGISALQKPDSTTHPSRRQTSNTQTRDPSMASIFSKHPLKKWNRSKETAYSMLSKGHKTFWTQFQTNRFK